MMFSFQFKILNSINNPSLRDGDIFNILKRIRPAVCSCTLSSCYYRSCWWTSFVALHLNFTALGDLCRLDTFRSE